MSGPTVSRRELLAIGAAAGVAAGSRMLSAQPPVALDDAVAEIPPVQEVVNLQQFEDHAATVLDPELFQMISGSDRRPFDLMTFRPRQNSPVLDMDLGSSHFGQELFTPIIAGPISAQRRFHAEGELATLRGAAAANALTVISSQSSVPISEIAAEGVPFWYSVYSDEPDAPGKATAGVSAGAGALFITVGVPFNSTSGSFGGPQPASVDWSAIDRIRLGISAPVILKGVSTAEVARVAVERGIGGVVVSTHGRQDPAAPITPLSQLREVVDEVGGRVPVLVDGSFRRGTDVLKALILGADAAMLGRPIAWGLSAYGADGVRAVIQLVQNELARSMAMLGTPTLAGLTPRHLRIHSRATS